MLQGDLDGRPNLQLQLSASTEVGVLQQPCPLVRASCCRIHVVAANSSRLSSSFTYQPRPQQCSSPSLDMLAGDQWLVL